METAASSEVRNAPSSYPTATRHRPTRPVRASILPDQESSLPLPYRANRFCPIRNEPGPRETRASPGKRTDPQRGVPANKGDRRRQEGVGEQSYEPIVPMKVGNRRAPARGGHGTHWREGLPERMYRSTEP